MSTQTTRPPVRPASAPARAPSRMQLGAVRKGVRPAPDRILLVGTEGIGKSSFAAAAPAPIFIAAEDGVRHLNVASFPEPQTFGEVLDGLRTLATEQHDYKTAVIDTVDWIEPLIWRDVCERNGWPNIEHPGYGKGYAVALEDWRKLLVALDHLRNARGMEIILLAHATVKAFSNPAGGDYSRYECKLAKAAAALVREWCDANLFAVHEEFVTEAKGLARSKGVSTGRRVLKTERCAAWDAKNRHGLPAELPLDYQAYAEARAAGQPASPEALLAEIHALGAQLDLSDKAKAWLKTRLQAAGSDSSALAALVNVLREKIAAKGETTGPVTPSGEAQ